MPSLPRFWQPFRSGLLWPPQTGPKLILFDEPAEGIRPNIVGQIEDVIVRLNGERGLAGVLVEQNIAFTRHADQRFIIPAPHHPGA